MTVTADEALTKDQRFVLWMIYMFLHEHGEWPKYADVYRPLRLENDFPVGKVFKSIPERYVIHHRPIPCEPSPRDEVRLTLRGIEAGPLGRENIELFTRLLRTLAEIEQTFEPEPDGDLEPHVTASKVGKLLGIDPDDEAALGRLFAMLQTGNWGTGSSGYKGPSDWSVSITPDIYRYGEVQSVDDCFAAWQAWKEEAQAAIAVPRADSLGYHSNTATLGYTPPLEVEPVKSAPYVDEKIAQELRAKEANGKFDLKKLLALIDELNDNHASKNTYSCLALVRMILDHVPPILGCKNFDEVASSYPGWSSSAKNRVTTNQRYMQNLLAYKKNGDGAMHNPASPHEDLLSIDDVPSRVWVNVLLRECAVKL